MNNYKISFSIIYCLLAATLITGCATTDAQQNKSSENNKIERISDAELQKLIPLPTPNLALSELVALSKSGMSADDLIEKIKQSGTHYALTPSKAIELHQQGVDSKVLDYLYTSQLQVWRDSVADDINRREVEHNKQITQLMKELQGRPYYYDPFWPSAYYHHGYPYW